MSFPSRGAGTEYHDIAKTWAAKFPSAAVHLDLISSAAHFAQKYMSQPHFDSSHNFDHIRRVVALSEHILGEIERCGNGKQKHDASLVVLGALLHDVGDRKYSTDSDAKDPVNQVLRDLGADQVISRLVQTLTHCVSYSFESKNPQVIQNTLITIPELAIVQDADRLDAIGALGIGRCFTFTGAKHKAMEDAVGHFSEKMLKLEGMMKTSMGREMARKRTERLSEFLNWWNEEVSGTEACVLGLERGDA